MNAVSSGFIHRFASGHICFDHLRLQNPHPDTSLGKTALTTGCPHIDQGDPGDHQMLLPAETFEHPAGLIAIPGFPQDLTLVQNDRVGAENNSLFHRRSRQPRFLQRQLHRRLRRNRSPGPALGKQAAFNNLKRYPRLPEQRRPAGRGRGEEQLHPAAPPSPA